jgi:nitroimidazol reductase NimA-like FMN-containing flavoprotein (pyridoxamine 5'-phosphate oxidase superfamily)
MMALVNLSNSGWAVRRSKILHRLGSLSQRVCGKGEIHFGTVDGNMPTMLEKMKAMVRDNDICVLATTSEGKPHCSLMAYVPDEGCREIYMVSHRDTRKFRNLLENPAISLLIDTRESRSDRNRTEAKALTVSGVFEEIEDPERLRHVRTELLGRHPHLDNFMSHPDAVILCIRVSSFLLLDGLVDAHFEAL